MLNPEFLTSASSKNSLHLVVADQESMPQPAKPRKNACPKCRQAKEAKDRLEAKNSNLVTDLSQIEW